MHINTSQIIATASVRGVRNSRVACLRLLLLLLLVIGTVQVQGQCLSIYKNGLSQMNSGKYAEAIKSFEAAKECDNSLSADCEKQIRSCRSKLADYYYKSGTSLMTKGKYAQAISALKSAKSYGASGCDQLIKECRAQMNATYDISLECDTIFFPSNERSSRTIAVGASEGGWKVRLGYGWCDALPMDDNKKLTVECSVNGDPEPRTTALTIYNDYVSKELVVVQAGLQPRLRVEQDTIDFTRDAGYCMVNVDANVAWQVELVGADWLTVEKNSDLMLTLTVEKSKKEDRTCKVLISTLDGTISDVFVVRQRKPEKTGSRWPF